MRFLDAYFHFIRKALPTKTRGAAVGLDIGTRECKLIQLQNSSKGIVLQHWAIASVKEGNPTETIRRMLEDLNPSCRVVYSSVSGKGTLIRYINMPKMSLEDLRNSFAIEADKYFPFAQNQIYTDCYILDHEAKGTQMPVMVAAVKKELIDERVKMLTELGVQPEFIGINAAALANIVHVLKLNEKKEKDTAIALLDMGESVSNLTIMINHLPWFTRDIFSGGQEFTRRLSNASGISLQDAEEIKKNPGERTEELLRACESVVMNIIRELRLSFDYFSTERGCDIHTLYLTGGGAMLKNLTAIFEKNLDVKVERWRPFDALILPSDMDREALDRKAPQLSVALGLALYTL